MRPFAGYILTLRRLVLANVTLAKPDTGGVPTLWPLQLFAAPPTNLSMADVRLIVPDDDFQSYLAFFTAAHAKETSVYHTVSRLQLAAGVGSGKA